MATKSIEKLDVSQYENRKDKYHSKTCPNCLHLAKHMLYLKVSIIVNVYESKI